MSVKKEGRKKKRIRKRKRIGVYNHRENVGGKLKKGGGRKP